MTVTYIGSLSIGASIPGSVATLELALPDIQARLAALASFAPTAVSYSAQIAVAQSIVTGISASIAAGITPPSISAQFAAVALLIADLTAQISAIGEFSDLMAVTGIHAYAYAGAANLLGAGFTTELSGGLPGGAPGDHVDALVLATSIGSTWTAMSNVFKVTP
jgi:hypothetical protein